MPLGVYRRRENARERGHESWKVGRATESERVSSHAASSSSQNSTYIVRAASGNDPTGRKQALDRLLPRIYDVIYFFVRDRVSLFCGYRSASCSSAFGTCKRNWDKRVFCFVVTDVYFCTEDQEACFLKNFFFPVLISHRGSFVLVKKIGIYRKVIKKKICRRAN